MSTRDQFGCREAWVLLLAMALTSCQLSEPQFPRLQDEENKNVAIPHGKRQGIKDTLTTICILELQNITVVQFSKFFKFRNLIFKYSSFQDSKGKAGGSR